jgi:hypothetical protein
VDFHDRAAQTVDGQPEPADAMLPQIVNLRLDLQLALQHHPGRLVALVRGVAATTVAYPSKWMTSAFLNAVPCSSPTFPPTNRTVALFGSFPPALKKSSGAVPRITISCTGGCGSAGTSPPSIVCCPGVALRQLRSWL